MAKTVDNTQFVTDHIKKVKSPYKEMIEALRKIILGTDKEIAEHIKWNVPAFYYSGEMKPFDPKEYKRDLIVSNLQQKDHVLLIFPSGAKLNDKSGLLEGEYKDGRRLAKFYDLKDVKAKEKKMKKVIKDWLKVVEK